MMTSPDILEKALPPPSPARPMGTEQFFDPVIRAIMACDGVGREKTIAVVLSAVESAFPR